MRLTCPNCGAQYEVADDVIPEGGRDVQCSNCGHVWFESPGGPAGDDGGEGATDWDGPAAQDDNDAGDRTEEAAEDAAEYPETSDDAPDSGAPDEADSPAAVAEEEDEDADPGDAPGDDDAADLDDARPEEVAAEEGDDPADDPTGADDGDRDDDDDPDEDAGDGPEPDRPRIDPEVERILREEAEYEQAARAAESADPLESQDDLGIEPATAVAEATRPPSETDREAAEAARNVARLKGDEATVIGGPLPSPDADAARRDQLPDIEEINSSLSASGDGPAPAPEVAGQARRGSGFRLGFGLVCLVATGLAFLYIGADRISAAAPGLEATMSNYTEMVDVGRLWLDMQVQGLIGDGAEGGQ